MCNHTFRATGITLFRKNGGDLRVAQQIAAHADIKTTAIYDHSGEDLQRAEVERVQL
jgi:site-specific recombinase XerD